MIKVKGYAMVRMPFEIVIDVTEEEFDSFSRQTKDEWVIDAVDWEKANKTAIGEYIEIEEFKEANHE